MGTVMLSRTFSPGRETILIQCFNYALVIFIREHENCVGYDILVDASGRERMYLRCVL